MQETNDKTNYRQVITNLNSINNVLLQENEQLKAIIINNNIKIPGLNTQPKNEDINNLYFQIGAKLAPGIRIDQCNLPAELKRALYIQIGKNSHHKVNNHSQQHNTKSPEEQEVELTKQAIQKSLKDLSPEEQEMQNALLESILPQQKRIIKTLGNIQIEEEKINVSPLQNQQKPPQKQLDQNHIDDEEDKALQRTIQDSLKKQTLEEQEEELIQQAIQQSLLQEIIKEPIEEEKNNFSPLQNQQCLGQKPIIEQAKLDQTGNELSWSNYLGIHQNGQKPSNNQGKGI